MSKFHPNPDRRSVRVCHVTTVHHVPDPRIFLKQCFSLNEHGYRVYVLVSGDGNGFHWGQLHPIRIGARDQNRWRRLFFWPTIFGELKRIDPDIIHFHDPELIGVGLVLKSLGKKLIYDVHEDLPRQILFKHWIPGPARRAVALSASAAEKLAFRSFDAIVTATETIEKRFEGPRTATV